MVANSPGILPKAAVTTSRAVYYPFTIPQKMNDSATLTGAALNGMVKGINASVGNAYAALEPRGPAKWLLPLFQKVDQATDKSDAIAQRNKTVFWDPFSQGVDSIGQAVAGPGAYWYLRKSGVEQPSAEAIKAVLSQKLFDYSPPAGFSAADAPVGASQAEQQAAEGAGEVGAEQEAA